MTRLITELLALYPWVVLPITLSLSPLPEREGVWLVAKIVLLAVIAALMVPFWKAIPRVAKRHQSKTATNFVLSPLIRILVMTSAKAAQPLSLEEYLALEREAPVKHELLEGFPHAMAGASDRHNRVVVNLVLVLALGPLAREKGRVEVRSRPGQSFTLP